MQLLLTLFDTCLSMYFYMIILLFILFVNIDLCQLFVGPKASLNSMSLQSVRVEHCERVQVITAAKRICIANCRECVFFLGVNQRPLILGDNHKLQVRMFQLPRLTMDHVPH